MTNESFNGPAGPTDRSGQPRRRVMVTVAHPDDETFGLGSLIAGQAANGVAVTVVCATRGEEGEPEPGTATAETLARVREAELRAAAALLGAAEVVLLEYRDSGMAGAPSNAHAKALSGVPLASVVDDLTRLIRRVRPHVLVTMEPGGGYGHPDHIRIVEASLAAVAAAGEPAIGTAAEPWAVRRVYFHCLARSLMRGWIDGVRAAEPDSAIAAIDPETLGTDDREITTVIDATAHLDLRWRAIAAHASQRSPYADMPDDLATAFLATDRLVRAVPPFTGVRPEADIFDGL